MAGPQRCAGKRAAVRSSRHLVQLGVCERSPNDLLPEQAPTCSVENLSSAEQHDVQSDRSQVDFAVARPIGSGAKRGTEESLEHAVGRFDLPALSVATLLEMKCHLSSPAARGKLGGRPAD